MNLNFLIRNSFFFRSENPMNFILSSSERFTTLTKLLSDTNSSDLDSWELSSKWAKYSEAYFSNSSEGLKILFLIFESEPIGYSLCSFLFWKWWILKFDLHSTKTSKSPLSYFFKIFWSYFFNKRDKSNKKSNYHVSENPNLQKILWFWSQTTFEHRSTWDQIELGIVVNFHRAGRRWPMRGISMEVARTRRAGRRRP